MFTELVFSQSSSICCNGAISFYLSGISLDCLCFAGLLNIFTVSIADRYKNGILFNIAEKHNETLKKIAGKKNQPLLCKSGDLPPVSENVCNLLISNCGEKFLQIKRLGSLANLDFWISCDTGGLQLLISVSLWIITCALKLK